MEDERENDRESQSPGGHWEEMECRVQVAFGGGGACPLPLGEKGKRSG